VVADERADWLGPPIWGTERREGVARFGSESKATRVAPGGKHLPQVLAKRAETLDAAYATNPAQFRRRPPEPPKLPTVAWINEPHRSRVDSVKKQASQMA
jgi:hypothetical protein